MGAAIRNNVQILDAIRRGKNAFSKKDLVRETDVPWTTMCKTVSSLLAKGFIFARKEAPAGRGRPVVPLCINPGSACFVGMDVGASQTKAVVCDLAFNVLYRRCDSTPEYQDGKTFLNWLFNLFDGIMEESGIARGKLFAIGLSVSGNVDSENGIIVSGGNFGMKWGASIPAAQALQEHANAPVFAITTAAAGAWAEYQFGLKAGCGNLVTVGLGVGIGSGIVSNHKLLISQPGCPVGYIGHILAPDNKNVCTCGFRGCLESYSGGKSLARVAKESLPDRPELHDAHALDLAAEAGEKKAVAILRRAASYNAVGVASMIQLYSPEFLVISGGQARRDGFLYKATLEALDAILPDERRKRFSIALSSLGRDQSALGAARLAYERFF